MYRLIKESARLLSQVFIREGQGGSFELPAYSYMAAKLSAQAVPVFGCGLRSQHGSRAAPSRSVSHIYHSLQSACSEFQRDNIFERSFHCSLHWICAFHLRKRASELFFYYCHISPPSGQTDKRSVRLPDFPIKAITPSLLLHNNALSFCICTFYTGDVTSTQSCCELTV